MDFLSVLVSELVVFCWKVSDGLDVLVISASIGGILSVMNTWEFLIGLSTGPVFSPVLSIGEREDALHASGNERTVLGHNFNIVPARGADKRERGANQRPLLSSNWVFNTPFLQSLQYPIGWKWKPYSKKQKGGLVLYKALVGGWYLSTGSRCIEAARKEKTNVFIF